MKKKAKDFLKKSPKRIISLLMCLVLIGLMFPAFELRAHADSGDFFEYDYDGVPYFVIWSDEWGEGTAYMECETCNHVMECTFTDRDHESAADMIFAELHPYGCPHCEDCAPWYHCMWCGGCFDDDVERCVCETRMCIDCHYDSYYCDLCHECRQTDYYYLTGYSELGLPGLDNICGDCYDKRVECANCNKITAFDDYYVYEERGEDWCEECNLCSSCIYDEAALIAFGHCKECGICGEEENVCPECHYCDNCIAEKENHCPECDECFGDESYPSCEDGGEHCVLCCGNNDWVCTMCDECIIGKGSEFCPECGLCVDCCYEMSEYLGCTHGYCIKSSDYEDHLCPECLKCPQDTECEYCGYCEECAEDYHCEHEICPDNEDEWEEHLCDNCGNCFELDELCEYCHMCEDCWEHCKHGLCPEESEYYDHICDNCGECFEEDEFCEYCELCPDCCEENTLDMDCEHELCVESPEFADHYCFEHFQCLEYCDHYEDCEHEDVSSAWSKNSAAHWHKCLLCGGSADAEPHIAGDPVIIQQPDILTRTMGIAQISCKKCGQKMEKISIPYMTPTTDGSPYILSQPKDYDGKVSVFSDDEEVGRLRYAAFTVIAGGENNTYQWYYRVNGGAAVKLTDEIGADEYYEISGKPEVEGSTKNRLIVLVDGTSCHRNYEYWCVIKNAKGSVTTRYAKLASAHDFSGYQWIDADTHIHCCLGDGCTATRGSAVEHRFTQWQVDYPATTTSKGQEHRVCRDCYYYETAPIQMIEEGHVHNWVKYGYDDNYHWKQCLCGKKTVASEHYFPEDWEVISEPTEQKTGKRARTCHTCFYEQVELIEKLPHTHNFTAKKDAEKGRYEVPNGFWDDDYHYTMCAGKECTSMHKEKHTYSAWNVMYLPFTARNGGYHSGHMYRRCTECGHYQEEDFDNSWPILTEVLNADNSSGFGGAVISGPTSANKGDYVTLTIELQEGFYPDLTAAPDNGWSLNEVTSNDGIYVKDKFYPYQNQNGGTLRQTFSTNSTTYSATFTMPDGPIALGFFVKECDHKGQRTHRDTIEPTCTGYGATVDRCNRCNGIVKEVSRTDPKGHFWGFNRWIQQGDCNTLDIYEQKCIYCGKTREHDDGYHHQWFDLENAVAPSCYTPGHKTDLKCGVCGEYQYGDTIKAIGHHNWGEWVTLVEPTNKTKGSEERQCTVCGETQTRIMDYVGQDYELRPDTKNIKFDFTYGDEVEPVIITFKSTGRNPVRRITDVDLTEFGQDAAYKAEIVGNLKVKITPNMNAIWGYVPEDIEHLVITGTDVSGKVEVPEINISTTIRKSPEKFNISIDGGSAEWEKTYTIRRGASIDAYAGCELKITAKDRADFDHWEVEYDPSGLVSRQLESGAYHNSPTAYIMLPQNKVKLRAVYKHIRKIEIDDLFLPAAGASPRFDVTCDTGLYTINEMRWVQSDNGHELTSSETFISGKQYYAEFYVKPNDPFILSEEYIKGNVFINGGTELVDQNWTKPYSQQDGWYLVTTNDIDVVSSRNIDSFNVSIAKPEVGSALSFTAGSSTKYVELANSRTNVRWFDQSDLSSALSSSEIVKEGHSYVVYVKLASKNGYQFVYGNNADSTVVTVNGEPVASADFYGSATSATVRYEFNDEYAIYDLSVTDIIEPVAGQTPTFTASVPADGHYRFLGTSGMRKNGIMWQDDNGNYLDPNDPTAEFEAGKQYSCLVFLEPDADKYHIAKDICTGTINGNEAEVVYGSLANRYLWLKYTFTCTGSNGILGDVDDDGEVSVIDATLIQRYEAGFNIPIAEADLIRRGDVDDDGEASVLDATLIQRYNAGFAVPYNIGDPI